MKAIHGGNIRRAAETYRLRQEEILDFSANINPLGVPPRIRQVICENVSSLCSYPDPDCSSLRKRIAQHLGIRPGHILVGNGSVELIYLICSGLMPTAALVPVPTFSEYEHAMRSIHRECVFKVTKSTNRFHLDLKSCLQAAAKTNIVFLCNPNNPTGSIIPREELLPFIEACANRSIRVVVDEAFMDFTEDDLRLTLVKEATRRENLLVLRSLTKFFALPGLRVGYLVGPEKLVACVAQVQPPWSVNALAQVAAREVLGDKSYMRATKRYLREAGGSLFQALQTISGLHPFPMTCNFVLCELRLGIRSGELCDQLAKRGLLVRDCSTFRGLDDRFIRIAVRKPEENAMLVAALREVMGHAG